MKTTLPIGSVVLLEKGTKPVMIFGYLQQSGTHPGVIADYIGVPYPEGNINMAVQVGFQAEEIKEVLFEGYRTAEFEPWEQLMNLYQNRKK